MRQNNEKEDLREKILLNLMWIIPVAILMGIIACGYFVVVPWLATVKHGIEPNGMTQEVEILTVFMKGNLFFEERICIYEIEGIRSEIVNCLYNEGDKVTVYQINDGRWYLERNQSK